MLQRMRWLIWFWSAPSRESFGFGPDASRNWHIAMDRWEAKEPYRARLSTDPAQQREANQ